MNNHANKLNKDLVHNKGFIAGTVKIASLLSNHKMNSGTGQKQPETQPKNEITLYSVEKSIMLRLVLLRCGITSLR